jgi:hypothetical protein
MKQRTLRPSSHIDLAEQILARIPIEQKPYVLARLVLASNLSTYGTDENTVDAIRHIDIAQTNGTLQPPLAEPLATEIHEMVIDFDEGRRIAGGAVRVLLAWVLDNQVRETAHG